MQITVRRFHSTDDASLSLVSVNGKFVAFGLEDQFRQEKKAAETRIPAGQYRITLRTQGDFHQRYSAKFPDFHQGMLWVRDVDNFEYILIHIGNTEADTAGCLLIGEDTSTAEEITVSRSTAAYQKLYLKVVAAAAAMTLKIVYIDEDQQQTYASPWE